ncbi:hybrid sensor histidine kinase/response regulator [Marinobacter sp. AL4B]|uniref:ATP-binding response regulator n=1 Tax=Marinobacter sp. AL4B TaxID=2871173 RepID=UPI001CAA6F59|nr:hybrid sensor histidine kinase/response regulator [Marinobacter sp. AL4B]MBZ0335627.1 hybrid sensor histidine kinase/response regulator [Marinobacter sp. AL4B]
MTDNRERILQERHNLFMNEVGSRMILSFCIAAALPLFFMDMLKEPSFFGWYALLFCVGIQSFAITRFYNGNREQESQKTGKWHRINLYLALIWAILWSAFPYLFLQGTTPVILLTCLVLLSVATSVPSVSMGVYPDIFISFITPVFLAWLAFILLFVPESPFIIKVIPLANLLSMVLFSLYVHKSQISTIALRIEAEKASELAHQASDSKTRFLAAASHDLRQPLQAATLYSAMLKNNPEPQPDIVRKLDSAIASCNELLGHLLMLSRLQSQRLKPRKRIINLAETLQPVIDEITPQARAKGLTLEMNNLDDQHIFTDAVMFTRIVRNLLSNALKYTPRGQIRLSARQEGNQLLLNISDTGIGIDEAYQSMVFEEFMQIDDDHSSLQNGLGLGLAIVSKLSVLCDIPVNMQSRKGAGTTFTLSLAAAATHQPQPADNLVQHLPLFETVTVLLIDDDKDITEALGGLLESRGATVSAHHSLESALQALNERGHPPSVVITDDQIGPTTNAGSVIEAITALFRQPVPTLIITGNTSPEFIQTLPDDIDVLFKPVTADALTAKLAEMLSLRGAA